MLKCKNCACWNIQRDESGQCRKNPPAAALIPTQGIGGQTLAVVSFWPETKSEDWCNAGVDCSEVQGGFTLPLNLKQPG